MGMRGVRRKSFPVLLPGPTHGPLSGPREVPPLNACRGKMAVAAEVSGEVLTAGEAPGWLGRWGRG